MKKILIIYDKNELILELKFFVIKNKLEKKKYNCILNIDINTISQFNQIKNILFNQNILNFKYYIKIKINNLILLNKILIILNKIYINIDNIIIILINIEILKLFNINNLFNIINFKKNHNLILLKIFCHFKKIKFNLNIINIFNNFNQNILKTINYINQQNYCIFERKNKIIFYKKNILLDLINKLNLKKIFNFLKNENKISFIFNLKYEIINFFINKNDNLYKIQKQIKNKKQLFFFINSYINIINNILEIEIDIKLFKKKKYINNLINLIFLISNQKI